MLLISSFSQWPQNEVAVLPHAPPPWGRRSFDSISILLRETTLNKISLSKAQELIPFSHATISIDGNIKLGIILTIIVIVAINDPLSVASFLNVFNRVHIVIFNRGRAHILNFMFWFFILSAFCQNPAGWFFLTTYQGGRSGKLWNLSQKRIFCCIINYHLYSVCYGYL